MESSPGCGHRSALSMLAGAGVAAIVTLVAHSVLLSDSAPPREPPLRSRIQYSTVRIGEAERSFLFYVPAEVTGDPALLVALHGARGSGRRMRVLTAYEFDRLADLHNFIVVYPDGFGGYWNDCRRSGAHAAKRQAVDDVGFLHLLIARFRADLGVSDVFIMGYSNGGQMAYRMALEHPDEVTAIAAVAANLPTLDNCICRDTQRPIAAMIVNGTNDPINPYDGGPQGWFGFSGGTVRSAVATATYFSHRAGYRSEPTVRRYPELDGNQQTWVERATWDAPDLPEVSLYTVHGGGHTIPQAQYRLRRLLGPTDADIDTMEETWKFFQRQRDKIAR
jgi:polyhydroxybutyrate depolymerase